MCCELQMISVRRWLEVVFNLILLGRYSEQTSEGSLQGLVLPDAVVPPQELFGSRGCRSASQGGIFQKTLHREHCATGQCFKCNIHFQLWDSLQNLLLLRWNEIFCGPRATAVVLLCTTGGSEWRGLFVLLVLFRGKCRTVLDTVLKQRASVWFVSRSLNAVLIGVLMRRIHCNPHPLCICSPKYYYLINYFQG